MSEAFIKNRRSELRSLEETLIGYRGQKELLNYQHKERDTKVSVLLETVGGIAADITALAEIRDSGRDIAAEESILAELRKQRNELLADAAHNGTDKAMQDVLNEIRAVEATIAGHRAQRYQSSFAVQIAEAEAKVNVLYGEHARINKALADTVVGYKCPVCAIIITTENIEAVKGDLRRRLSALVDDGKAVRNTLTEIKARDDMARREFEGKKAAVLAVEGSKLSLLNQSLQDLNIARELDSEDYGEKLSAIEARIREQEYRLANGNLTPEQVSLLAGLEKAKKEHEIKIEALANISDYDYNILIANTEAEIIQLKRLISEVVQYTVRNCAKIS